MQWVWWHGLDTEISKEVSFDMSKENLSKGEQVQKWGKNENSPAVGVSMEKKFPWLKENELRLYLRGLVIFSQISQSLIVRLSENFKTRAAQNEQKRKYQKYYLRLNYMTKLSLVKAEVEEIFALIPPTKS